MSPVRFAPSSSSSALAPSIVAPSRSIGTPAWRACARCGPGWRGSTTVVSPSASIAGEQHARLDLGAGDRQLVADPVQPRAVDGERRQAAVARLDARAPSAAAARRPGRPAGGGSTRRRRARSCAPAARRAIRAAAASASRVADVDRRRGVRRAAQAGAADRRARPGAARPARRARAPRRASRACPRPAGSRATRTGRRPSHRASPRDARSTCPPAASGCRAAARWVEAHLHVTDADPGSARGRVGPVPATQRRHDAAAVVGDGASDMSVMLMPARPSSGRSRR